MPIAVTAHALHFFNALLVQLRIGEATHQSSAVVHVSYFPTRRTGKSLFVHVREFALILQMPGCFADEANGLAPLSLMAFQAKSAGIFERSCASPSHVTILLAVLTE